MERCQAHIDHLGNLMSISRIYNAALRRPYRYLLHSTLPEEVWNTLYTHWNKCRAVLLFNSSLL